MQGMCVQYLVVKLRSYMLLSQETNQNIKQKQYYNKLDKDFKISSYKNKKS